MIYFDIRSIPELINLPEKTRTNIIFDVKQDKRFKPIQAIISGLFVGSLLLFPGIIADEILSKYFHINERNFSYYVIVFSSGMIIGIINLAIKNYFLRSYIIKYLNKLQMDNNYVAKDLTPQPFSFD